MASDPRASALLYHTVLPQTQHTEAVSALGTAGMQEPAHGFAAMSPVCGLSSIKAQIDRKQMKQRHTAGHGELAPRVGTRSSRLSSLHLFMPPWID